MSRLYLLILCFTIFVGTTGCSPEVGSEAWCKKLEEKPKGEWTGNEATEYAKNCVFRQ